MRVRAVLSRHEGIGAERHERERADGDLRPAAPEEDGVAQVEEDALRDPRLRRREDHEPVREVADAELARRLLAGADHPREAARRRQAEQAEADGAAGEDTGRESWNIHGQTLPLRPAPKRI